VLQHRLLEKISQRTLCLQDYDSQEKGRHAQGSVVLAEAGLAQTVALLHQFLQRVHRGHFVIANRFTVRNRQQALKRRRRGWNFLRMVTHLFSLNMLLLLFVVGPSGCVVVGKGETPDVSRSQHHHCKRGKPRCDYFTNSNLNLNSTLWSLGPEGSKNRAKRYVQ
jgi:hypothetical protein